MFQRRSSMKLIELNSNLPYNIIRTGCMVVFWSNKILVTEFVDPTSFP